MNDRSEFTPAERAALRDTLARAEITRAAQDWALFRDAGRWDALAAILAPDGVIHTTWFVGPVDAFIDRSRRAFEAGARVHHLVGATTVTLQGARAIAETAMAIMVRGSVHEVEVDVVCWGRFHDRMAQDADGSWRIHRRIPIYVKDQMQPVVPGDPVTLDLGKLRRFPEGYRHLAYLQSEGGATITPGLPTPHSEALSRLDTEGAQWLAGGAA